ncbi:MAG: FtsQ-type POTRA domain-containing protein [Ilumatobacteraceae bacterium]
MTDRDRPTAASATSAHIPDHPPDHPPDRMPGRMPDKVPDKVLEELLAAFAGDALLAGSDIDLDDPSIDALLGLGPAADPAPDATPVTTRIPLREPTRPGDGSSASVDVAAGTATEQVPETPVRPPIKIGGGPDDFVDAVYLDEEGADRLRGETGRATEASVERTTILIGDDEIEGSSGGIPVAAGNAMDPRLRARRIAVRRAVGRRRLKWFLIIGSVVVVVAGALAVLGSSLFEVKHVTPSGVSGNTNDAYEAALEQLRGHPVLLVDTHQIESQLERNPWVREARVMTDFPDSATVEIVERVPIATYQGSDGRFRIIDVEGAVLVVIENRPLEFMLISGPGADAEAGGSAGDAFRHAAELVEALSPAVRARTERVVVGETGELSLMFASTEVILGAPEELLEKLTRLEAVLKRSDADSYMLINVSTPEVGVK